MRRCTGNSSRAGEIATSFFSLRDRAFRLFLAKELDFYVLSVVLVGLFVWLFVRVCWMLDSVFPTATRATYCLGIFEPKLEREILLAQPSEIQTQGKHGITLPCRNARQAKSKCFLIERVDCSFVIAAFVKPTKGSSSFKRFSPS